MKFYIASRLENAEQVKQIAAVFKASGWVHTYDWTEHGSVQCEGEERIREVAEAEMKGVKDADVVIVLLPGGRGTHAELGAAIALDKKVFVWAESEIFFMQDERTCAFYWNYGVDRIVGSELALLKGVYNYASFVSSPRCV